MVENLSDKKLLPINVNAKPMGEDEALLKIEDLRKEWRLVAYGNIIKLESGFKFSAYEDSCRFVGIISRLCRDNGYAPDITFGRDYAFIALFSHSIGGLHENDFIMAAKIDEALTD